MANSVINNRNHDDLRSIQTQIHEKKTGMLDSVRSMRGYINESEVVGANTAAELVEQREKLENIEKRCDAIDANLVIAHHNLNKLGSIFGGIKNYLHPPKSAFHKSASQPQLSTAAKKKSAESTLVTSRSTNLKDDTDTYFGKRRSAMDDLELETEDGLYDIHQGINRLKLLALQMNEELVNQEPLIGRVDEKVTALVKSTNEKTKQTRAIMSH